MEIERSERTELEAPGIELEEERRRERHSSLLSGRGDVNCLKVDFRNTMEFVKVLEPLNGLQ